MSTIKINRAKAQLNHLPAQSTAIWDSISFPLLDRLTAAELAEVARCLDSHWHKAVAFRDKEILEEGAMRDESKQKLREIGQ